MEWEAFPRIVEAFSILHGKAFHVPWKSKPVSVVLLLQ